MINRDTLKSFDPTKLDLSRLDLPRVELKRFDLPRIELKRLDLRNIEVPTITFPKVDVAFELPKMERPKVDLPIERLTGLARDAAYVGIGAVVVAAKSADDRRREATERVTTRVRKLVDTIA